jgi:biopolymer transport protein ExbD
MPHFKRNIPQLNTTSTADIAFILLLFFLLTGSLDPKSGIYRRLAPATAQTKLKQKTDIKERNLITFAINENNEILLEEDPVKLSEIRNIAKIFIANPDNLAFLPEKKPVEIEGLGTVALAKNAVINFEISRDADYQTYISVLSELTVAYEELRREMSYEKFNKPFSDLSEEQQTAIREAYPLHISEKERPGKEDSHE